ncbi:glucuronide transporter [Myceligenerans pegani]|uniref:Glucuronide transporter n=1 Tax=Myceligenerans pegani TaxID=2776917 RepID=A0ABR9N3R0_9MICO|nr:glucuronide transporter [Myceligenerans sp. TRM 65318]MBE1878292.1 glucuronide transporter [Myceligenerans sp. TRM 65318]MBE3020563.1 glucuronide transporter [Myceligenerans sp. TRM 65318]
MADGPAQGRPLRTVGVVGYGAGDAANNVAFMLATQFLLLYYTDVAGITAAAAGTLFLVLRVFDAVTDLVVGRIVDRTSTRFGKFRPYLLFGAVPLLLLSIATFTIPPLGETGVLLYAYVTYAMLGIAYTFVNIPYGALAAAMTQEPAGRAKLASARTIGGTVVGAALGAVVAPLLDRTDDLQRFFTTTTVVLAVIGIVLYTFCFLSVRETVERDVPAASLRQSVQIMKGNRPLLILCVSAVLMLLAQFSKTTAQVYYMRDVFDALSLMPILSISQLVVTFAVAPVVPSLVRRWGKRPVFITSAVFSGAASLVAFVAPTVWIAMGALMISLPAVMIMNIVIWAFEADTVEYGEWRTGVRAEGIIYSAFSFTRKVGQALGASFAAYALALTGYVGGAETQTEGALWGIRASAGLLPGIFVIAAGLLMLAYPLTDAVHARLVAEIEERRRTAADDESHEVSAS